jgi:hypothetical protein
MQEKPHYRALASLRARWRTLNPRTRLALAIAGGLAGVLSLALVAVNLLISADWVRERVAQRVKEETGRELRVSAHRASSRQVPVSSSPHDLYRSGSAPAHRFFSGAAGC